MLPKQPFEYNLKLSQQSLLDPPEVVSNKPDTDDDYNQRLLKSIERKAKRI